MSVAPSPHHEAAARHAVALLDPGAHAAMPDQADLPPMSAQRRTLLFAWLGWLAVFFALITFFQLSLLYRVELGLDDDAVKRVKSLALAATGVGGILLGVFADRVGRRPAMAVSLALYAAGALAAALAHSLAAMLVATAIAGLGIGGQWASGQTLLAESVPARSRGRFGALAQTGAPLGLGLATLAATQLAPRVGWRAGFLVAAAPVLLVPAILALVPESAMWRAHRAGVARGERPDRAPLLDLFAPGVRGRFGIAFVLTLFNMASYWLTTSWLPEYLGRQWHLTIQRSGAWTLVFVAGSLSGYVLYGLCSDRWGRRLAFSAFSAIMALGLAMITLFQGAIRDRPEIILGFIFLAGVGTGTWSHYGPLYAELFPTRLRSTASGTCMNVARGAQFVTPLLVVAVGGAALLSGVALAAGFALAAGAWVWLLPETRAREIA